MPPTVVRGGLNARALRDKAQLVAHAHLPVRIQSTPQRSFRGTNHVPHTAPVLEEAKSWQYPHLQTGGLRLYNGGGLFGTIVGFRGRRWGPPTLTTSGTRSVSSLMNFVVEYCFSWLIASWCYVEVSQTDGE